ncbi:MAG: endonuclease/exonuclease/phosphatase family protein [Hyphomicrobiales bacterium]
MSTLKRRLTHYPLRSELTGIVMFGFAGLLVVALAPYLAPDTPLRHLDQGRMHIAAGFFSCTIVFLVLKAYLRAAVSFVIATLLSVSLVYFASAAFAPVTADRVPDFSLISFNVLGENPRGADLVDFLIEEAPDVAVILEAPALHDHLDQMWAAFPFNAGCGPGDRCDMAVFSRHRLSGVEVLPFYSLPGRLIVATLELETGPVTLIAAHLTKPYYGDWHVLQLERLAELLDRIEGPLILAGDFNSQPFVRAFRRALLERSGLRLASRMQQTWPALGLAGSRYAGFAIDHVLVRGDVSPVSVELIEDPIGSNHRGFLSRFDLNGQ